MSELTAKQKEILDSYLDTGNKTETARLLGSTRSAVRSAIAAIEKKGLAPWLSPAPVPPSMSMCKTTVQYDAAGNVKNEWRRLIPEAEDIELFVETLCDKADGKANASDYLPAKHVASGTLFEIVLADAHIGMYATEEETLDSDYDCDIAKDRMVSAVKYLLSRAGNPEKIVISLTGDTMHSDNRSNRTEKSGNVLDVDTRFQRVVDYVVTACTEVVQMACKVAPEVEIVVVEGNHDFHSSIWLKRVLKAFYSGVDNVTINMQKSSRKCLVWGENLLVWTHGDGVKAQKWGQIIPAEFAKEWGATKHRYLKMGHVHHRKTVAPVTVDEQCGLHVEYCEALTSMDAWSAGAGFVGSTKGASAFEYDKEKGMTARFYYNV